MVLGKPGSVDSEVTLVFDLDGAEEEPEINQLETEELCKELRFRFLRLSTIKNCPHILRSSHRELRYSF